MLRVRTEDMQQGGEMTDHLLGEGRVGGVLLQLGNPAAAKALNLSPAAEGD